MAIARIDTDDGDSLVRIRSTASRSMIAVGSVMERSFIVMLIVLTWRGSFTLVGEDRSIGRTPRSAGG